jgi:hypothetical protein
LSELLEEVIMNLESQDKSVDPATGKLVVFEDKQVRRVLHNGEWFFSVVDVVEVLTEISKATFGMTPSNYKKHKGLKQENLRDHMTSLELVFSMLGEVSTKEIAVNQNAQGFTENKAAVQSGGRIAGDARKQLEKESGKPVISLIDGVMLACSF